MPARALSVAVVGAPYGNKDGSNRQFEIRMCTPGERLELRPEPRNRYDEHAIAVFTARGIQIGYVSSERAVLLGSWLRAGEEVIALFQAETAWGAVARVGVGGAPELPTARDERSPSQAPSLAAEDSGFWPDPVYDD